MRSMSRIPLLAIAALCLTSAVGCVERRFVIDSDPPGAMVLDESNRLIGFTPVDKTFVYYGKYQFKLVKDGYETLTVTEQVVPPWYERFLIDFVSENLVPINLRDIRRLQYKLCPSQVVPPEGLLQEAENMRARGRTIGEPLPPSATPIPGQPIQPVQPNTDPGQVPQAPLSPPTMGLPVER